MILDKFNFLKIVFICEISVIFLNTKVLFEPNVWIRLTATGLRNVQL